MRSAQKAKSGADVPLDAYLRTPARQAAWYTHINSTMDAVVSFVDGLSDRVAAKVSRLVSELAVRPDYSGRQAAEPSRPFAYSAICLQRTFRASQMWLLQRFSDGLVPKHSRILLCTVHGSYRDLADAAEQHHLQTMLQFVKQCLHAANHTNVQECSVPNVDDVMAEWPGVWEEVVPILVVPPKGCTLLPTLQADVMAQAVAHGAAMLGGPAPPPPQQPSNWPKAVEPWPVYYCRALELFRQHYLMAEGGWARGELQPAEFSKVPTPTGSTDRKLVGAVLTTLLDNKESHGKVHYYDVMSWSAPVSSLGEAGIGARAALAGLAAAHSQLAARQAESAAAATQTSAVQKDALKNLLKAEAAVAGAKAAVRDFEEVYALGQQGGAPLLSAQQILQKSTDLIIARLREADEAMQVQRAAVWFALHVASEGYDNQLISAVDAAVAELHEHVPRDPSTADEVAQAK